MSSINIKQGGNWVTAQPWVKVTGTGRQVGSVWVKDGGTWREIAASNPIIAPTVLNQTRSAFNPVDAGIRFNTDGTFDRRDTSSGWAFAGNWLAAGATASDYDIYWTQTSVDGLSGGGPVGQWNNMGSTAKYVLIIATTPGTTEFFSANIQIRNTTTQTVLYNGTHALTANYNN